MKIKTCLALLCLFLSFALAACDGAENANTGAGDIVGQDEISGNPQPVPEDPTNGTSDPNSTADPTTRIGETCHKDDPEHICLALKYVVYVDSSGTPIASSQDAIANVATMNTLWSQCNIGFEIGNYLAVNPSDYGFSFNTSSKSDLPSIRTKFEDNETLLVVSTGTWSGTLGAASTNAWTMMPGTSVNGTVLEAPVARSPKLIAHEIGHYLNLDHVSDTSNMMNPVIYQGSTALTASQCSTARAAAKYYWSAMYR